MKAKVIEAREILWETYIKDEGSEMGKAQLGKAIVTCNKYIRSEE